MQYNKYYVSNAQGKSNCIIRSFCKIYDEEYDNVYQELCDIAKKLNCSSYTDIDVFEAYMKKRNTIAMGYGKDIKVMDLVLDNEAYIIFCWDKNEYYHMVPIIDNVSYDKNDNCLELYVITIYKQNYLIKNK